MISRSAALCLIALILTPFTAPFPSYFFTDSANHHPTEVLPKGAKDEVSGGDAGCLVAEWLPMAPPIQVGALVTGTSSSKPILPSQHCLVLRI